MILVLLVAASEILFRRGNVCESIILDDVRRPYHTSSRRNVVACTHRFQDTGRTKAYISCRSVQSRVYWEKSTWIGNIPHFSSVPNDARTESTSADEILIDDVSELRRRASELRSEAHALELSLEASKLRKKNKITADVQNWINLLFVNSIDVEGDSQQQQQPQQVYIPVLPNASTIARIIQKQKFSEDQLSILMKTLYQRRNTASLTQTTQQQLDVGRPSPSNDQSTIDSIVNGTVLVGTNQTEVDLMGNYMQLLLDALSILDQSDEHSVGSSNSKRHLWSSRLSSQLASRLNEWSRIDQLNVRRRTDMKFLQARKAMDNTTTISSSSSTPHDGIIISNSNNVGSESESFKYIPRWIPPSLFTTIYQSKEARLDPLDITAIKERVLMKTRFYCTSSDSFLNIAIFRGNMRPGPAGNTDPKSGSGISYNFSAIVFDEIQRMMEIEGLANRIQLFLLNDPDWKPNTDVREPRPRPVIIALPKELTPQENNIVPSKRNKLIQEMSPIVAVCSTIIFSIGCYALNPIVFDGLVNRQDISVLSKCVPLVAIILGVHGLHEIAHQIMARKRDIIIGLPLLIPSMELGSFGSITKIKSFPSTRSALFDVAMSGPLAATVLSLILMMVGCYKTIHASNSILLMYPTVPLAFLKSSFLTGSILTVMIPKVMMMPSSQPIPIHPFFVGGFTMLIASALNMLPVFRLDGGRACTAIVGTRLGALTSAWTMLSLLSLGMSGSGLAWTWGAFVLLFQRQPEITPRDDVTPVGTLRTIIFGASLALSLLILLPFPGAICL